MERRIADVQTLSQEIALWESDSEALLRSADRNSRNISINWRFQTKDARNQMGRLYPPV